MSIFKSKSKKENRQETLQELQEKFNKVFSDATVLHHRKYVMSQELSNLNAEINRLHQEADKIGIEAKKVQGLMQEELQKAIKKGEANVQEAPKAS